MRRLETLYSPINIAGRRIRNRIVLAPMGTRSNLMDGTLTDRCSIYLEERAKGGAGLIIPELTAVKEGYTWIPSMQIYSDRIIPALSRLAASMHAYDTRIIMQLALHGGRAASWITHKKCIAPSAIMTPIYKEVPEALTEEEIYELVEDWKSAAIRTKRADFDGVEVHGCHGYLINQFISPATNKRKDRFGGSLENRMHFAKLIVNAIREACGKDFIIGFKMSAYEHLEEGVHDEQALEIAKMVEAMGVDYIHVSALSSTIPNHSFTKFPSVPSIYDGKNCLVPLAEMIKRVVSVPIITTGAIVEPEDAEKIIDEGKADLVAVGRAFLADAHWGLKPQIGGNIRPCIGCMICHKHTLAGTDLACAVNPGLLREFKDLTMPPARNKQKVMIIGGGPGGMETAIQAYDQGHDVTLYERDECLGGALQAASAPPFKYRVKKLLNFYLEETKKRNIKIVNNCTLDAKNIGNFLEKECYDVVVLAVGGVPSVPPVDGIHEKNVFFAEEVIKNPENYGIGTNIAIIGAGKVGLEAAWMLADMGKSVNIFEKLKVKEILCNDHPTTRSTLMHNLDIRNVIINADSSVEKIEIGTMHIIINDNERRAISVDSVLLAAGYKRNASLFDVAKKYSSVKRVYEIGDGKQVRGMMEAIHEGYYTGRYVI